MGKKRIKKKEGKRLPGIFLAAGMGPWRALGSQRKVKRKGHGKVWGHIMGWASRSREKEEGKDPRPESGNNLTQTSEVSEKGGKGAKKKRRGVAKLGLERGTGSGEGDLKRKKR